MEDWVYVPIGGELGNINGDRHIIGDVVPHSVEFEQRPAPRGSPMVPVEALNKLEGGSDYKSGFWLYKPHSKILYNDTEREVVVIGEGGDGTFSWDKPVPVEVLHDALIGTEFILERDAKGHFEGEQDDPHLDPRPVKGYRTINQGHVTCMEQEEEVRSRFGDPIFWQGENPLAPAKRAYHTSFRGECPAGLESVDQRLAETRPLEYQNLLQWPTIMEKIHNEWIDRIDRGVDVATETRNPFRPDKTETGARGVSDLPKPKWTREYVSSQKRKQRFLRQLPDKKMKAYGLVRKRKPNSTFSSKESNRQQPPWLRKQDENVLSEEGVPRVAFQVVGSGDDFE
eukprot:GHVN01022875.1.p1 GENE.GHVN01022875.1~~GHVN01022875.1.p1  ORF type:complete len:341 (+),score=62.72 GHVN01022875.1:416-1438(+)